MVSGGQNAAVSSVSTVMIENRHKPFSFSLITPLCHLSAGLIYRAAFSELSTAGWGGEVLTKSLCTCMNI